jgi:threonine dehydratase
MSVSHTSGGEQVLTTDTLGDAEIITNPAAKAGEASDEPATASTARWSDVTLDDVHAARERVMPHLHRTPLISTSTIGKLTGTELSLKAEVFQRTGSFKSRGALNAALHLTDDEKRSGVVTLSAGNHGQGLAFAARQVGTKATIFVPKTAVPTKVEAMRNYGADVRFVPNMETVLPYIEAFQQETGAIFVSPYDDPHVIAGQGVVGLEILEDMPDVETVVVPAGGGGLLAGVLVAIKSQRPDVRVVGVEPVGANVVRRSLDAGHAVMADVIETIADGLGAPKAGELSQAIIAHYVDDVVLVTDDEIAGALWTILDRTKILVEPAGAAAIAALIAKRVGAKLGSKVVAILSGGNVDATKLKSILP